MVPEKLTFITSFTKFPGEEISERLKYLGPAVQQRISKIITVDYFSLDEYLEYVDDLLQYYRKSPKGKVIPKYFPFDKKCLLEVFEMLSKGNLPLHPRTVNRVLSSLLESGLREKVVPINDKYLAKVKDQIQVVMTS